MQEIKVAKQFVLTLEDQTQHLFAVGIHKVEDAIADHWFVKAHSEPLPAPVDPALAHQGPDVDPVIEPLPASVDPVIEPAPVAPSAPEPEARKRTGKSA